MLFYEANPKYSVKTSFSPVLGIQTTVLEKEKKKEKEDKEKRKREQNLRLGSSPNNNKNGQKILYFFQNRRFSALFETKKAREWPY